MTQRARVAVVASHTRSVSSGRRHNADQMSGQSFKPEPLGHKRTLMPPLEPDSDLARRPCLQGRCRAGGQLSRLRGTSGPGRAMIATCRSMKISWQPL